jgi:hypothetical protein
MASQSAILFLCPGNNVLLLVIHEIRFDLGIADVAAN